MNTKFLIAPILSGTLLLSSSTFANTLNLFNNTHEIKVIQENKIHNDYEMAEKLGISSYVTLITIEEIELRRKESLSILESLQINTEDKEEAKIELNKIKNIKQFELFDNKMKEKEQKKIEADRLAEAEKLARDGIPDFDSNGRLIEVGLNQSPLAEEVIILLLKIPGHMNGAQYHIDTGLDNLIDQLTDAEAVHVIHRIEGPGFGQTGDGLAGSDSAYTDKIFVQNQVNKRFEGNIKNLLKYWGTNTRYGGY